MRLKLIALSASVLALAACSSKHDDPYANAYGNYDGYGSYGQQGQMGYGGQAGYGMDAAYGSQMGYGQQMGYGGANYGAAGCGGAMTPTPTPCGGAMQGTSGDCGGAAGMGGSAYGYGDQGYGMGQGYGGQGGGMAADCGVQMLYAPMTPVMYYAAPQYGAIKPDRMPWGIEAGIGMDFDVSGDIFPGEAKKPNFTSEIDPISYKDAWKNAIHYDAAVTYDLDHNTTVLGRVDYSKAKGRNNHIGTVYSGEKAEDLYAEFTDLEQVTLEGGVRQYISRDKNHVNGIRPYVAVTGGFTHTNDVDIVQSSATIIDPALYTQQYVYSGWSPTAAGMVGAEWQMGGTKALLLETGLRWKDNLDANYPSDDRIVVPVRLRGRISF